MAVGNFVHWRAAHSILKMYGMKSLVLGHTGNSHYTASVHWIVMKELQMILASSVCEELVVVWHMNRE